MFIKWLTFTDKIKPLFVPDMADAESTSRYVNGSALAPERRHESAYRNKTIGQKREAGLDNRNAHLMTPKTEFITHNFAYDSPNYRTDDPKCKTAFAAGLRHILSSLAGPGY